MPRYNGINFTDTGDGDTPLVLVHGFCCDHTDWDLTRSHLGDGHRAVALDLRGHGASDRGEGAIHVFAEDVVDLVESESLDNAILVGHSLGCRVVVEAGRRLGGHLRGLVLVDGSRTVTSIDAVSAMRAAVEDIGFDEFAGGLFKQMFTDKADADVAQRIVERARAHDADWALHLWHDMVSWDATQFEPALQAVQVPILALQTTFLNAQRQRVSMSTGETTEYTAFLEAGFQHPASRIDIMADTGHFPQLEEPRQLADLLAAFART